MIRVAITDDHLMVIEGIKTMLKKVTDIEIISSYTNVKDTISGIELNQPDVLLLDINLPDGNGINVCKELTTQYENLKIIALTNYEETTFIKQIMKNGAKGYLLKNTSKDELVNAINQVFNNDTYLPEKLQKMLLNESLGRSNHSSFFIPNLTKREKEVLALIIKEFKNDEIADKLFVTAKTVEAHRSNLIQKLGVKNTAGLVSVAFEKGLI